MLKILLIRSNHVHPEPKVEKEAKTLGDNGYSVEVLAWDRSGENPESENKESYKIKRIKLKASYGKPELVFKLILWSFYELIYLIKSDFDIVHAFDLDTLIPAVIVSKIKNKPLVYDCADFYADSLPENVPTIIRNFIANLEIFFSKFADFVILVDESRKKQFKNKLKKTIIINNTPMEISLPKIKPQIKYENFIIFYAGILHENRGLHKLIEATKGINNLKLMIAGYDIGHANLSECLEKAENVTFLGKISYEDVIKRTLESDMTFALYDPKVPNHKYASPNKLFEAMMCAKPILTNYGTVMAEIVMNENCGVLADYENVNDIKNAIIRLKNDLELRKKLGENGLKMYKTKYNWDIMANRLLNVYKSLT
jgi:glycosyltransferase involved in cell wall biosynthesis